MMKNLPRPLTLKVRLDAKAPHSSREQSSPFRSSQGSASAPDQKSVTVLRSFPSAAAENLLSQACWSSMLLLLSTRLPAAPPAISSSCQCKLAFGAYLGCANALSPLRHCLPLLRLLSACAPVLRTRGLNCQLSSPPLGPGFASITSSLLTMAVSLTARRRPPAGKSRRKCDALPAHLSASHEP